MTTLLPLHARPSHSITTPRLILRSALASDAVPFQKIRSHPQNNPFGGVVNATLSIEEQEARLTAQAASTAAGKNAFLNVILNTNVDHGMLVEAKELLVTDGVLVGMTGFNTFMVDEKGYLVGDTGVLIDYRFARRGLAIEALEAVVEYGFEELGCGKCFLETNSPNKPFRELMRCMGLGDIEQIQAPAGSEESIVYLFGKEKWEEVKISLKEKGKWYLS